MVLCSCEPAFGQSLDQSKKFDTRPYYVAGGWAAHEAGFGPGFVGKPNR
jgi:hypothetical protein